MTRQPRRTFYEAIEEREVLDGKPQRGVERGLAQEFRRYHRLYYPTNPYFLDIR
jgi:hypothetical protein